MHEEIESDYTLWVYPDFKTALREIAISTRDRRSKDEFVSHIYESLTGLGIPLVFIHGELDELAEDPGYAKAQADADEYWKRIQNKIAELNLRDIAARLDTSEGDELEAVKHPFVIRLIRKVLSTWETRILGSELVSLPLRVFSLHSPSVEGAACVYSDTNKESSIGSYIVRVFGVGGGGTMQTYLQVNADYAACNGNCYEIVKTATVQVDHCVEVYKGKVGEPYLRATPIKLERGYLKALLQGENDACQTIEETAEDYATFDLRGAEDPDQQVLVISKDKEVKISVNLNSTLLGSTFGLSGTTSSFTEKRLSYDLPGLHLYRAFELDNDFGYAWDVAQGSDA